MEDDGRFFLRCMNSGAVVPWATYVSQYEPGVGSPEDLYEVEYEYEAIRKRFGENVLNCEAPGIFRAWPLLPVFNPGEVVSLQEGNSPLLSARGPEGGPEVWIKNESVNPTGSFKDRYDCISVNVARSMGYQGVVCASTGNHALAVAAYAAVAGLSCLAIVAESASEQVLATLKIYGAQTRVVPASERFDALGEEARRGLFPVGLFMPGSVQNPFGVEGYKTIAYEIVEQLGRVPDAVVFPCARGNGLYGAWKGFVELNRLGKTEHLPRMYACQPCAASSLVTAFEAGSRKPAVVNPGPTLADAVSESVSSPQALEALYASGGGAVAVEDEEVFRALFTLGKQGVFAEASSALVWAGVEQLAEASTLGCGEKVVAVVTSTGLKSSRNLVRRILDEKER